MKILHYSLGFPPYRSGGMTTFCIDLMEEQIKNNYQVALLWPGRMSFFSKNIEICKTINIDSQILSFEIINPLPVSYDEGIDKINNFIDFKEHKCYLKLLQEFKPDVIHLHTFMGLHKSFLDYAKMLKIKIVFTTHDFFPICPRVTFIKDNKICDCVNNCNECNGTALSINKIRLLQSKAYRDLKESKFVKEIRKNHRENFFSCKEIAVKNNQDYSKLKSYYEAMFKLIDMIHYNSTFTKSIYEQVFKLPNSVVIPITHKNINNNKQEKDYTHNFLKIRFMGTKSSFKGFDLLKEACNRLYKENFPFCLDVHFIENEKYIISNKKYSYSDLNSIFFNTDILIVPSICEIFNYTVLEALSFGCPVIVSDTTGAKDIICDGCGIIINNITSEKLYETLKKIDRVQLNKMNQNIIDKQKIMMIEEMQNKIQKECYERR